MSAVCKHRWCKHAVKCAACGLELQPRWRPRNRWGGRLCGGGSSAPPPDKQRAWLHDARVQVTLRSRRPSAACARSLQARPHPWAAGAQSAAVWCGAQRPAQQHGSAGRMRRARRGHVSGFKRHAAGELPGACMRRWPGAGSLGHMGDPRPAAQSPQLPLLMLPGRCFTVCNSWLTWWPLPSRWWCWWC